VAERDGAGAPKGNKNAVSKKPWAAAIERALAKRSLSKKREALDDLAEKLLKACDKGDVTALKELADRLDGRSIQYVDAQVDTNVTVEILRFADKPSE
jgi:hypothetical protein